MRDNTTAGSIYSRAIDINSTNRYSAFSSDENSLVDKDKKIYDLKYFNRAVVGVQAPLKTIDIPHCYRYQDFRHPRPYYAKQIKRFRSELDYLTKSCSKSDDSLPNCFNCNHLLNYENCCIDQ
uniref:Uncharacterized protein n=1 Tax=Glossina palpalis gambiensis TaxID=67801 RepID=A0A1B0BP45_9MUSC